MLIQTDKEIKASRSDLVKDKKKITCLLIDMSDPIIKYSWKLQKKKKTLQI